MTISKDQFINILKRMKVGSSFSRIDLVQANEYAVKHNIDDLKLKTLKKIFLRGKDTDRENMGLKSRC